MRMRRFILASVDCPADLIKDTIFVKKKVMNMKCVFRFYIQILSKTYLIQEKFREM